MISGALGAACGVLVSNPLDVAKTRLQTQGALAQRRYGGVRDVLATVLREDGPRGLMRGLGPRLLYLCPSAAVTFALYEFFKKRYAALMGIDANEIKKRVVGSSSGANIDNVAAAASAAATAGASTSPPSAGVAIVSMASTGVMGPVPGSAEDICDHDANEDDLQSKPIDCE